MTTLFTDNFENGNFGNWSYVQAQNSGEGPGASTNYVAPASSFGIKAHGGEDVAQFYRPAGSPPHAKVFKEWSNVGKRDQFGRTEDKLPDGGNPDGVYKAWYFLPSDYKVTTREWTNIFQFKEEGYTDGKWHQDPSWWVNMSAADAHGAGGSEPILFINHWSNNWDYKPELVKAPLGRWFEIKAELHEGERIDWFLDGNKFDTSLDSTYPVGRFYDKSDGWIFGVGHYGGAGKLYVDDVSVSTLGSGGAAGIAGEFGSPQATSRPGQEADPAPGQEADPVRTGWSTTPAPTTTVTGSTAGETLKGSAADNKIDGGGGKDTMIGGKGDDTYLVDSGDDKVVEGGKHGADQIITSAEAYVMPKHVENLTVDRDDGAVVIGNALSNIITGDIGYDILRGDKGGDQISGGGGNDTFIFREGEAEGDVITDFSGYGDGDVLRFEDFGEGAKLVHEGEGWTVQYAGGSDTFKLMGVSDLAAGDFIFT